jgi:D-alanyl-lipoteichoic acid acyltransferase DltB (MBOAT superfamily)
MERSGWFFVQRVPVSVLADLLGLYYLSGQRYRNLLLLIASYVFYAWWRVDFLALFAASRCGTTGSA